MIVSRSACHPTRSLRKVIFLWYLLPVHITLIPSLGVASCLRIPWGLFPNSELCSKARRICTNRRPCWRTVHWLRQGNMKHFVDLNHRLGAKDGCLPNCFQGQRLEVNSNRLLCCTRSATPAFHEQVTRVRFTTSTPTTIGRPHYLIQLIETPDEEG